MRRYRRVSAVAGSTPDLAGARLLSVLGVREFRWLWAAGVQSIVGDQLARVALSVLVFDETGSALWTAATYAVLYLPALVGGLLFGRLADRFPRRQVMILADVFRAVAVGATAVPGLPLGVLAGLLAGAVLVGSVSGSAEPALIADLFTGPAYTAALGLRSATGQAAQLIGFGAGGLAVAWLGSRPALAADAVTFLISAAMLRLGVRTRPAAADDGDTGALASLFRGLRIILSNPRLALLLAFAFLTCAWIVPEGLAVPYAASTGGGAVAAGALLAANPAGNVIGVTIFTRWLAPARQARVVGPLAVLCGLPLVVCAWHPGLALSVVLWALSGTCTAYLVQVTAEYVPQVPSNRRGQAVGVLSAVFLVAQGLGVLAGGAVARALSAPAAIAWAGALGSVTALTLAVGRARLIASQSTPR